MRRTSGLALIAGIVLTAASCGGSANGPSATTHTLHGEVTDPSGDAVSDPRIPISPDLTHATADVDVGNLTVVIQFASGTFDRQTTRVSVLLDTDQDGSTGIREGDGMGADYGIDLAAVSGQAAITKADPAGCAAHVSCFNAVGSASITFMRDAMQVVVPLSLLGNDDGRMTFRLSSYVLVAPLTAVAVDFMPDNGSPPVRIQ